MKNKRRDFLRIAGSTALGLPSARILLGATPSNGLGRVSDAHQRPPNQQARKTFNMSGYAAPALDPVRVGIIGVGNRGRGTTNRLTRIEGVVLRAICDLEEEAVRLSLDQMNQSSSLSHSPDIYSGSEDSWRSLCDRDDIDLVIINTPWDLHAPQALYAMEQGKHVAVEVPIATSIEECWQLVETSERTRRHCMMLSNPCYRDFDMMALSMARDGFFGEIVHAEGAYIHDLRRGLFSKRRHDSSWGPYYHMWRLRENAKRNGNLYPTHGLCTICNIMDINCGDKMDYLVSVSSNDFMLGGMARELASADPFYEPFVNGEFRGNINISIIRTHKGRTVVLQHDVTSPRPGVRFNLVSGTKGIAEARPPRIATSHSGWLSETEYALLEERYTPRISRHVGDLAREIGGHGGMDTLMLWRLIDCLRNGIPLDMSVYDGVLWSAVGPLSEQSVADGSARVEVPDFTFGSWQTNERGMDIELKRGGTTGIIGFSAC